MLDGRGARLEQRLLATLSGGNTSNSVAEQDAHAELDFNPPLATPLEIVTPAGSSRRGWLVAAMPWLAITSERVA